MPAEDLYRDTDTLARVLGMIGATSDSVAAVDAVKKDALSNKISGRLSKSPTFLIYVV